MWLPTFSPRQSDSERQPPRRKLAPARLAVEAMEDRAVPAFLAPVTSPGGGDSIAVADFNRDGRDDVVVISGNGRLSVSLSNGDGTFRQASTLTGAKGGLFRADTWDVNGDGIPDVVGSGGKQTKESCWPSIEPHDGKGKSATCYDMHIYYRNVWLGNGDGTFGPVSTSSFSGVGTLPDHVYNPTAASADFNHDGVLDRAQVDASADGVRVELGNADGTFQEPQAYAAGPSPGSIAAGDFDGDGRTDLVVVNFPSGGNPTLSELLNDGSW